MATENGAINSYAKYGVPALDLTFADKKSLVDRISGNNLITFTRASTATYVGSDGLIKSASTNEARFDHNPTTRESLGLLVEEARTNLTLQSSNINSGVSEWGSSVITSYNAAVAPDGTTTAVQARSTNYSGLKQSIALTNGITYTVSVWLKAKPGVTYNNVVTVGANTFGSTDYASSLNSNSEWFRATYTFTSDVTTSREIFFGRNDNGNTTSLDFYAWGPQLEAGSFATSYIPTTTATVTRAADVASITGSNFSSWFNAIQGSFVSNSIWNGTSLYGNSFIWAVDDTNITQRYGFYSPSNTTRTLYTSSSSGTTEASAPSNSSSKVAFNYSANQQTTFRGGFVGGSTTNTYPTGINRFTFSPNQFASSASPGSIHHARLTYYPVRLPDSTLQALTAT